MNPWEMNWQPAPSPTDTPAAAPPAVQAPWEMTWAKPSTAEDVARSAASGVATGTAGLVGSPGDAQSLLQRYNPFDWLARKFEERFPETAAQNKALADKVGRISDVGEIKLPSTEVVKKATGADALDYTPTTTAGRYAESVGSLVPGALTGGVGSARAVAANIGRFAVAPGIASEAAGELLPGSPYEPIARIAASLAAPGLATKAISPLRVGGPAASEASHAANVARLEAEGIPLSAGERADNRGMRFAEDALDPHAYKERMEAVTRAATRRVGDGQGGTYETPIMHREQGNNTLDTMLHEVGRRFDDLSARNVLVPDAHMGMDLMNLRRDYTTNPNLYDHGTVDALHAAADEVRDAMATNRNSGGQPYLSGEQYQRIRSRINSAARTTESPQRAEALHAFVNVMDEAMERSVSRTNPNDAGRWAAARRDYRNALVIEDAAKASNVAGAQGYIAPTKLEAAAVKVYGRRAHERGYDPFDWAPAAKAVLKVEPNSGTASRERLNHAVSAISRTVGATAGSLLGHAAGMHDAVEPLLIAENALPIALDPIIRAAARNTILSRPGQAYLGNQLTAHLPGAYQSVPGLLTAARATEDRQ
jgi:hypothetical protein